MGTDYVTSNLIENEPHLHNTLDCALQLCPPLQHTLLVNSIPMIRISYG